MSDVVGCIIIVLMFLPTGLMMLFFPRKIIELKQRSLFYRLGPRLSTESSRDRTVQRVNGVIAIAVGLLGLYLLFK
jgi:hypothetical protein